MTNHTTPAANLLFYRYGSICEPDIIQSFQALGFTVTEENMEMHTKVINHTTRVETLVKHLLAKPYSFVFSINFFPHLAEICQRFELPYVSWVVDCPVPELFSSAAANSYNRIFLFDYAQYLKFSSYHPEHIYYMPLAANVTRWDEVIASITQNDMAKYSSEVSFVGSLYTEKSPLYQLPLNKFVQGYIDGLIDSQMLVYGYNFMEECITPELIEELHRTSPLFGDLTSFYPNAEHYIAAHHFLGMEAARKERIHTLNSIAQIAPVTLYTNSDVSALQHVTCKQGAKTLTEMPKIFHLSKINLNITIKPIQSGLSLRVWDILGCGGFLLSNYQSEIPEYFEPGKDLVCYESTADMLEKITYYLAHDDIRNTIAQNGYEKVKKQHTYRHRIMEILKIVGDSF